MESPLYDRRAYAQQLIDLTRERLDDAAMRRALGIDALLLALTAESLQVVEPDIDGKIPYQSGYQDTEMIPVVCVDPSENIYTMMTLQTPEQRRVSAELTSKYAEQYGTPADNDEPRLVAKYRVMNGTDAVTWVSRKDINFGDHAIGQLTRPTVLLRPKYPTIERGISVLMHELSHMHDIITVPMVDMCQENYSLHTELRAYSRQHRANEVLFGGDDVSCRLPAQVERIRCEHNGSVINQHAYKPKLAIKRALAEAGLSHIYLPRG